MAEVKKIEPLRCPQCNSYRVSAGFTKMRGRAHTNDGKVWCYNCLQVTNTRTGKVKSHKYTQWGEDEI